MRPSMNLVLLNAMEEELPLTYLMRQFMKSLNHTLISSPMPNLGLVQMSHPPTFCRIVSRGSIDSLKSTAGFISSLVLVNQDFRHFKCVAFMACNLDSISAKCFSSILAK